MGVLYKDYNNINFAPNPDGFMADHVGGIVTGRPFLTFAIDERIEHIVRRMQLYHQGAVGITDRRGHFIGLLTERDILRKIFGADDESGTTYQERHHKLSIYPESLKAADVMVINPVCLTEDMPVEQALEEIRQRGFRFMPVVKKSNKEKLTGIVSERELFWHTQDKMRRLMDSQNNLLSYFMHHESYGGVDINRDF